jgi:hypothetical protein
MMVCGGHSFPVLVWVMCTDTLGVYEMGWRICLMLDNLIPLVLSHA